MSNSHEEIPARPHIEPIGDERQFLDLMQGIQPGADGQLKPDIVQDGRHEIHHDLAGITFKFWLSSDGSGHCGINFEGAAPKAPWAYQLTGKVFNNFSEAKGWLRQEAERLSKESHP